MRISDWSSDVCSSDLEAALDLMVKIFGFGRYREGAAFRSHKKLEPDGIFKVSDELAHRRLRQVHRLCGFRDRPRDHDRPKRFQLAQIHPKPSQVISIGYRPRLIQGRKE